MSATAWKGLVDHGKRRLVDLVRSNQLVQRGLDGFDEFDERGESATRRDRLGLAARGD
jgi:hypothetical protein